MDKSLTNLTITLSVKCDSFEFFCLALSKHQTKYWKY